MERFGSRQPSWKTMPTPPRMAAAGPASSALAPRRRISPLSGFSRPIRIFIRVDFPAPFSPTSPRISLG